MLIKIHVNTLNLRCIKRFFFIPLHLTKITEIGVLRNHTRHCDSRRLCKQPERAEGDSLPFHVFLYLFVENTFLCFPTPDWPKATFTAPLTSSVSSCVHIQSLAVCSKVLPICERSHQLGSIGCGIVCIWTNCHFKKNIIQAMPCYPCNLKQLLPVYIDGVSAEGFVNNCSCCWA